MANPARYAVPAELLDGEDSPLGILILGIVLEQLLFGRNLDRRLPNRRHGPTWGGILPSRTGLLRCSWTLRLQCLCTFLFLSSKGEILRLHLLRSGTRVCILRWRLLAHQVRIIWYWLDLWLSSKALGS